MTTVQPPVLVLTQGDPAGVGPEILLKLVLEPSPDPPWRPLLVLERAALASLASWLPPAIEDRLHLFASPPRRDEIVSLGGRIAVLDPVAARRQVVPGRSTAADAGGAIAALDAAVALVRAGVADALVTAPLSKLAVARHHLPDFRGHTEYLAAACGLERYGRDYLMAFLAADLQVALLSTHLPLTTALAAIDRRSIVEALSCLDRAAGGRLAVAGVNPHAGEGGLLGAEEREIVDPAVVEARRRGIDVSGSFSPDSLFARARRGEFDWVLALYHDQGLIAVKTAAFGSATNWTLGLPYLRTSVDHGTAFELAGRGVADHRPLVEVVRTTLALLAGELPRGRRARR